MLFREKGLTKKKYYQTAKRCRFCNQMKRSWCDCAVGKHRDKKSADYYGKPVEKDQMLLF